MTIKSLFKAILFNVSVGIFYYFGSIIDLMIHLFSNKIKIIK